MNDHINLWKLRLLSRINMIVIGKFSIFPYTAWIRAVSTFFYRTKQQTIWEIPNHQKYSFCWVHMWRIIAHNFRKIYHGKNLFCAVLVSRMCSYTFARVHIHQKYKFVYLYIYFTFIYQCRSIHIFKYIHTHICTYLNVYKYPYRCLCMYI